MNNPTSPNEPSRLKNVTPVSKYLAMVIFVVLPFLAAYIGYQSAPVKIVEVEKVLKVENQSDINSFLFDYKKVEIGQELGNFVITEKEGTEFMDRVVLQSNNEVGEKIEGKLTAFRSPYTDEYLLGFVPYMDSYKVPYMQNRYAPGFFIVTQDGKDTEELIRELCEYDCTASSSSEGGSDIFAKQVNLSVKSVEYIIPLKDVDSMGDQMVVENIEVLE